MNPNAEAGTGKLGKCPDRQRIGKTTLGIFCPFRWQARRARSDAPYRAGYAAGSFDFVAHFGVRVESELEQAWNPNQQAAGVDQLLSCVAGEADALASGEAWVWAKALS